MEPSKFTSFLWRSAGGDKELLLKSTYLDRVKFSCLGGTVLGTAVMAVLSGGYAMYTVFEPNYDVINPGATTIAVLFGILWGLIIFNIDRFIVSSMRGKTNMKMAMPRIVLGAIIAYTISQPVELRMFKAEIEAELHKNKMAQQEHYASQTDSLYEDRIHIEEVRIADLEAEIKHDVARSTALEDQYIDEARIITVGPRALAVKVQLDQAKVQEAQTKSLNQPLIDACRTRLKKLQSDKQSDIAHGGVIAEGMGGLLMRLNILHEITSFWIALFITSLFMSIELMPLLFKMMLPKGTYDYLEENRMEMIRAEQGILIQHKHFTESDGTKVELVHHVNVELFNAMNRLQLASVDDLAKHANDAYLSKEKKKIDQQ